MVISDLFAALEQSCDCKNASNTKNKLKSEKKQADCCCNKFKILTFASAYENMGKSYTVSSLRILQDGNVAKVVGCSGAIQVAYPPASLAQLARARDL